LTRQYKLIKDFLTLVHPSVVYAMY
jgi:hypothetical protein